ncbi:hypothetical protein B0H34DRAFT_626329, partial [Crassisporium funariophilum]
PFRHDAEWELAKWPIKNLSHNQAKSFQKLQIVKHTKPSYWNKSKFLDKIDSLPRGVDWACIDIEVEGNMPDFEKDPSGNTMHCKAVELWFWDPIECVRELMGNPAFRDMMKYAPKHIYMDKHGKTQVINEM